MSVQGGALSVLADCLEREVAEHGGSVFDRVVVVAEVDTTQRVAREMAGVSQG